MNREILFRGKRTINNEWVEGFLFKQTLCDGRGERTYIKIDGGAPEVYPETVGQFTGLLDKNGTKIFEGDVYQTIGGGKTKYVVEFKNGAFCGGVIGSEDYMPIGFEPDDEVEDIIETDWYTKYLEVTSNIHETK